MMLLDFYWKRNRARNHVPETYVLYHPSGRKAALIITGIGFGRVWPIEDANICIRISGNDIHELKSEAEQLICGKIAIA